jgi:hypothetical protein
MRSAWAILAGMTIAFHKSMSTEIQHITQQPIKKNQENSTDSKNPVNTCPQTQMHRYAWLEHENGTWHFLTSLFADTAESTRRWSDRQRALDELKGEGWTIIRPYLERSSKEKPSGNCPYGYGLMLTIH